MGVSMNGKNTVLKLVEEVGYESYVMVCRAQQVDGNGERKEEFAVKVVDGRMSE